MTPAIESTETSPDTLDLTMTHDPMGVHRRLRWTLGERLTLALIVLLVVGIGLRLLEHWWG